MRQSNPEGKGPEPPRRLRCAIYTRKSTEEGLEQEFSSLDAQREAIMRMAEGPFPRTIAIAHVQHPASKCESWALLPFDLPPSGRIRAILSRHPR